ncbi:alpha-L-fucosidase 2 [Fusarium circinatum]|uniref:Alpha-L-fucosidase 2 n=1 Tax=Fusarium circinatum TaxID=48490 RepID=A0A8H5UHK3_FUSCI|nr:alpha-L-fucosidase 2 [Fusarium circinatum]
MYLFFLYVFVALVTSVGAQKGNYSGSRHLWYNTPGSDFRSSLPIGNGRLGALVQGSISEKIIINENSVWSGTFQDRVNPSSLKGFPQARKLLTENNYTGAAGFAKSDMFAIPPQNRWYSVTGNLLLDFGHTSQEISNYERWLDTLSGNTGVSYDVNGVTYTREVVANFPLGVIAARFTASKNASLNIGVSLQRDRGVISNLAVGGGNNITMDVGGSGADAIPFTTGLRVVSNDGTVKSGGSALNITKASTVDLFLDVETSFQWSSESAWKAGLVAKLDKAAKRGFESLKAEAISDHQSLMQRVDLDLGSNNSTSSQPTDKRVSAYASNPNDDPEFVTLSFQFGRHLLVSSSRDTGGTGLGVPANLQGIWNDMYNPPWGSKFTVNINTEMNYWLAETTDLTDTLRPLWDLMYRSRDKGSQVATKMYGCPGYVSHHNLDLWGDSAPHDSGTAYTIWPSSNLWLSQHMMEHYRFTGDKNFLGQKAWPLFKDIASFFDCYLFRFNGQWTSGPSTSPENVFIIPKDGSKAGSKESLDISITIDNSLLREFFSNVIEAAGILGIGLSTDKVLSKVKGYRDGLRPTQIGARGQIQEWRKDYTEAEPGHRHYSHLVDLFPAKAMSPLLNKTLANAAQKSIELRLAAGGASTGWSRVWTAALYARLLNGDKAYGNIQTLLGRHPAPNLFHNIEPGQAFQIDSNFGLVAAVAETLVQSQAGVLHILPALGSQVKTGSVSGLVARGGFQVSIVWKDGLLVEAKVKSRLGNTLKVRVAGGSSFEIDGKGVDEVETTSGQTYTVTLA